MKVKVLKPVFLGSVVPKDTITDISEDDHKRFGEGYFEVLNEGNDSDGNTSRTEDSPKTSGRPARSKT